MRKWIKGIGWLLFLGLVIFIGTSSHREIANEIVQTPDIHIRVNGENAFLTEEELKTRLQEANLLSVGQQRQNLNIEKIEQFISAMSEVKTVDVYTTLSGNWDVDIDLRVPIVHVFNTIGENYYVDADGVVMQKSPGHTARILVASGYIRDPLEKISVNEIINNDSLKSIRNLDDLYRISNYVCNDPLMHSLIGQIYLQKNGDFILVPIVGGQKIIFGDAASKEEVEEKFEKLAIFYKEAIPHEGWAKYKEISLKYTGQIIGRKIN